MNLAPPVEPFSPLNFSQTDLKRDLLLQLLQAALACHQLPYAGELAWRWLQLFPGDLEVAWLYAETLAQAERPDLALPRLTTLCRLDPEYLPAQQSLARLQRALQLPEALDSEACILALGGVPQQRAAMPGWAALLKAVGSSAGLTAPKTAPGFVSKNGPPAPPPTPERAQQLLHLALRQNPPTPLAAIFHLRAMLATLPAAALQNLTRAYQQRWPECLLFRLVLAQTLLEAGQNQAGVACLHAAAAQDLAGQTARRLWGQAHPYRSLWPTELSAPASAGPSAPQGIPVPPAVTAAIGWSRPSLPPRLSPKQLSPASHEIQQRLDEAARRLQAPTSEQIDRRYPVYVIFSSYTRLQARYGPDDAHRLDQALRQLSAAVNRRPDWNALVYYPDAPQLSNHPIAQALAPIASPQSLSVEHPWQLKLALADLDAQLGRSGEMIGALLIVGGPEVIPFHRLPNPLDDDDSEVPSDSPYGARGENDLMPEWPVGRLPALGPGVSWLMKCIQRYTSYHQTFSRARPAPLPLNHIWRRLLPSNPTTQPPFVRTIPAADSIGYSAAVWQRASLAAFDPIGPAQRLHTSPPPAPPSALQSNQFAPLAYFNLHGLADSNEWFGQSDPAISHPPLATGYRLRTTDSPDFPVALRPQDIPLADEALASVAAPAAQTVIPRLVFSEACYGARLPADDSIGIAQRFLQAGSLAVVASTCTSYGSVGLPLVAADFLAYSFWQFISQGFTVGEALQRARLHLTRSGANLNGALAPEDQKTLLSFVCYGDPLAQSSPAPYSLPLAATALRPKQAAAPLRLICDRRGCRLSSAQPQPNATAAPTPINQAALMHIKKLVAAYLPGMQDAQIQPATTHTHGPAPKQAAHPAGTTNLDAQIVILSKSIATNGHRHRQFARLTLDAEGKLLRLAVSR